MTGLRAGSGGTGLLGGSRPGSGVQGGVPAVIAEFVGGWADNQQYQSDTPVVTSPFTADPSPATYFAFVAAGYHQSSQIIGQPQVLSGMGSDWTLVDDYYYNPAGTSRSRMAVWKSDPGVSAVDGPLTVRQSGGQTNVLAATVIAVKGKIRNVGIQRNTSDVDPLTVDVPDGPIPANQTLIAVFSENHVGSATPGVVDPDVTLLGRSGPATAADNRLEVSVAFAVGGPGSPLDLSFSGVAPSHSFGGIVLTIAEGIQSYDALLLSNDANAQYPLRVRGTDGPTPDPYDVEILTTDPNAIYPLETRLTGQPGEPVAYDTENATMTPSTLILPGPKGVGADPAAYDTENATMTPSTLILPGPKGVGADPADYDTEIATLGRLRYVPGGSLVPGAAIPDYDTEIATLGRLRYVPADAIVPPA